MWDETGAIREVERVSGASRELTWQRSEPDQWTLSGLSAHPTFTKTGWLYIVEMAATGNPALRLSRYRQVGDVLGERAVLLQTPLDAKPARTFASFGPDGYLYVALLSSANTAAPSSVATRSRFLIRVNERGVSAPGNQPGSLFVAATAQDPVALAFAPDNPVPWVLTRLSDDGYVVTRLGDGPAVQDRLNSWSAPVSMQVMQSGAQQFLYITGTRGDVRQFSRGPVGWTLRDGFRLFNGSEALGDALVLDGGEIAACGRFDGSSYGVWRGRLP
jgi:hypothetical protein